MELEMLKNQRDSFLKPYSLFNVYETSVLLNSLVIQAKRLMDSEEKELFIKTTREMVEDLNSKLTGGGMV